MSETRSVASNPFDGWVSLEDAAQIVGFSRTALRYWADQGYIQAYVVGQKMRLRLVNVDEVTAYAEERRKTQASTS